MMAKMTPGDEGRRRFISVPMTEWANGTLGAPEVQGALLVARQSTSVDVNTGREVGLIRIEANRAGFKWLAYHLLAIAHAPDGLAESRLHVHVIDEASVAEANEVAVAIYWNEDLRPPV